MSTEAAGQAKQDAVEAGRVAAAVDPGADEAPGTSEVAQRAGRGEDGAHGPGAADDEVDGPRPVTGDDTGTDTGTDAGTPVKDGAGADGASVAVDATAADGAAENGPGGADSAVWDGEDGESAGRRPGAVNDGAADNDAGAAGQADEDEDDQAAARPDGDDEFAPGEDGGPWDGDEYGEYDEYSEYDEAEEGDGGGDDVRPRRWPRVLLIIGFVLAAVAIVGGALAIVGSVTHGFKKPVKVTYKKSALFSLKTGDCFDSLGQSYTLSSCDVPHQAEVFATFSLAGGTYPGNSAIVAAASQGCASRLTSYLNPELAIDLASTYVYPDATAWQAGTRTVICEVRSSSGQLTGSVRGASATAG
jgi:hypothetical protein